MRLMHFSNKRVYVLDPKYHGTGTKGAELKRKFNDFCDWVDRTYYYIYGTKPEDSLKEKRYIYYVDIPDEKIYNFKEDPNNLSNKTRWPNGFLNATAYEKAIKEAGYLGYYNGGYMNNVVAIFYALKPYKIDDRFEYFKKNLSKSSITRHLINMKTENLKKESSKNGKF